MRLSEALAILNAPPPANAAEFCVSLVCGFAPLHLKTFLAARLRRALPDYGIAIESGLYGDLLGNFDRSTRAKVDCVAVVLEWQDLDERLGFRSLAGWNQSRLADILETVRVRLSACRETMERISGSLPVALCLPTLPLPPLQPTAAWNTSVFELQLQQCLAAFSLEVAQGTSVRLANSGWLNRMSPITERFDAKSELLDGFPYGLKHTSAVSEVLTNLIQSPPIKKGLITDLDNTLWKGLAGEVGPDGVSWNLDQNSHMHAVYQELLCSLSRAGVLVAVASKNDPELVQQVFRRNDIILDSSCVFPFEVHWAQKSRSVSRILEIWNVAADSVIFVDDNPSELAEVKAAHVSMECFQFPSDPQTAYELIGKLRDLFAKPAITEEDRIRAASIRNVRQGRELDRRRILSDDLLESAESLVTLSFAKDTWDPRVLELVNKTNQFNLNGKRWVESALRRELADGNSFLLKASYTDKFGALGKIAMILGRACGPKLEINTWVMSCRAFSRRIEYACLDQLFKTFEADELVFDFLPTDRNKPLQEFFEGLLGRQPEPPFRLSNQEFYQRCPRLFHKVENDLWMISHSG